MSGLLDSGVAGCLSQGKLAQHIIITIKERTKNLQGRGQHGHPATLPVRESQMSCNMLQSSYYNLHLKFISYYARLMNREVWKDQKEREYYFLLSQMRYLVSWMDLVCWCFHSAFLFIHLFFHDEKNLWNWTVSSWSPGGVSIPRITSFVHCFLTSFKSSTTYCAQKLSGTILLTLHWRKAAPLNSNTLWLYIIEWVRRAIRTLTRSNPSWILSLALTKIVTERQTQNI